MKISTLKEKILKDNGFLFNSARMMYVNKKDKKIFSVEALDDHDEIWLKQRIIEKNNNESRFYFNEFSDVVIKEILNELEK